MRAAWLACEAAMLIIAFLVALGLAGYLLATLIAPERF
jgi:K+-transporting ATPase KdpF subunit